MNLDTPTTWQALPTSEPLDEQARRRPRSKGPDDTAEPEGQFPDGPDGHANPTRDQEHEGATEEEIGDRRGPGAGYDQEPEQAPDKGGVA